METRYNSIHTWHQLGMSPAFFEARNSGNMCTEMAKRHRDFNRRLRSLQMEAFKDVMATSDFAQNFLGKQSNLRYRKPDVDPAEAEAKAKGKAKSIALQRVAADGIEIMPKASVPGVQPKVGFAPYKAARPLRPKYKTPFGYVYRD